MTDTQQRVAAKKFAEEWKGRGYEKGESQPFWLALLRDVYGVEKPEQFITFEEQVHLDHTSFIDGVIPETKVLIEQKGLGKNLNAPIKQSDGSMLNPFNQAKRYITELPLSQHPRWVVTCNFSTFFVYDMEKPQGEPERIELANLEKDYYRLAFLVDVANEHVKKEMEVSIKAGEIVGLLYDAFLEQYKDRTNEQSLKSLNKLCVRLVFCLYAEDAGVFGHRSMFHDYLQGFDAKHMRKAVIELFEVLNQKPEERDQYLDDELAAFPYVNGGLFADTDLEIPQFNDKIRDLLLEKASANFDWSEISPTIFGAVFESTLNPETRRSGGMHYTSIENIHKVIDPLFLTDLKRELNAINETANAKTRTGRLREFQNKIAGLTWLDPACGSGNFLTETYLSVRKLENEVISGIIEAERKNMAGAGQMTFGYNASPIQVSISQFYGIEINDFAVTVAKTALWIAESQMMKETEKILHDNLEFLPLKTAANIVEGNALRIDWETVVPREKLNYIMGNPPFVGHQFMSKTQRQEVITLFKGNKKTGVLDYVCSWYVKACDYIMRTGIRVAFVSTNSITQGEQVSALWKHLVMQYRVHIDFAYRTFQWDSEANLKAHVHCVIIGFSVSNNVGKKKLYDHRQVIETDNINAYLMPIDDIFIDSRNKPLCDVPPITKGCQPTDGGNLIIEDNELSEFLRLEPNAKKYIKKLVGAKEFINNKNRWCLWLVNASPAEIRKMPYVLNRIEKVREMRLNSTDAGTRKLADTPTVFRETYNPKTYIIVPSVSSEKRRYIPLGFLGEDTISTNLNLIIPDATLYHFGVLTSNVHMAWMRTVCGRLEMRYRYSKDIVYNNFPWPTPTDAQRAKIEQTAQAILDARALYTDCSLADLYDDLTMPPELRTAHQKNDKAVMAAYGITKNDEAYTSESACVALLMKLYQSIIDK